MLLPQRVRVLRWKGQVTEPRMFCLPQAEWAPWAGGPGRRTQTWASHCATLGKSFSFPGLGLLRAGFRIPMRGLVV